MKIIKVVALVLFFHVSLLGVLFFQPGCQTMENCTPCVTENFNCIDEIEVIECNTCEVINEGAVCKNMRFKPTRPVNGSFEDQVSKKEVVKTVSENGQSQPKVEGRDYVVKAGDSLWVVAKQNGITVAELAGANGISRDSVLKVGQKLVIPAKKESSKAVASMSEGASYTIEKGDTLSEIAKRFHVSVESIKSANGMKDSTIYAGKKIVIPGASAKDVTSSVSNSASVNEVSRRSVTSSDGTYEVKRGEFLSDIAKRFGVSVNDLMRWNNITDARKLRAGQALIVKGSSSQVVSPTEVTVTTSDEINQLDSLIPEADAETVEEYENFGDLFEDDSLFDTTEEIPVVSITEE